MGILPASRGGADSLVLPSRLTGNSPRKYLFSWAVAEHVLGAQGPTVESENGTIRIGTSGTHTQTHLAGALNLTSFLKQDVDSANYGVWIQGGASTAVGDARNLAILGRTDIDTLVLNFQSEYANGTRIESDLLVTGCINGAFCSDARLKVEIEPLGRLVLEEVLQLEEATYRWKDDRGQGTQIRLIAQEAEKVFPELVSTGSDGGQKGLSCTGLNAVIIQAIQELKQQKDAEIAALKAEQKRELAAIRADMEQRLARLESHGPMRLTSNELDREKRN